ncbi:hypothetical protein CDEN61S_03854 [Castellaniella denitrificans]
MPGPTNKKTRAVQVLSKVLPGAAAPPASAASPGLAGRHEVGARIRAARKERRLTLQQVARRSGLAVSTVSKAERGQIALSYEKVLQLGRALDIDMTRLFMQADTRFEPDAAGSPTVVKDRFADVQRYETDQYEYSVLCGAFPGKKMQPLVALPLRSRSPGRADGTARFPEPGRGTPGYCRSRPRSLIGEQRFVVGQLQRDGFQRPSTVNAASFQSNARRCFTPGSRIV